MAPPVELNRWLRDLRNRPYQFNVRAAGLHAFASRRRNVPIELPLLLTPEGAVGGLLPSLMALEEQLAPSETLFSRIGDRELVERLCASLFAPAVRTFYFHMLPARQVLAKHASAGVPWIDALLVRMAYPLWRRLLNRGLKLDGFDAEEQATAIDRAFSSVERELGPLRFLGGDEPCFRDIVFAVLASPVILPPGHPASIPSPDEVPDAFRSQIELWRSRPAGQLALRVYEHRPAPVEWGKVQADRLTIIQRLSPSAFRKLARVAAAFGPRVLKFRKNAFVSRHQDVLDVLARDGEFLIAPINRDRINGVMGPFILGMDSSRELQDQRAATYGALAAADSTAMTRIVAEEADRLASAAARRFGRIDVVNSYARPAAARAAVSLFGVAGPSEVDLLFATRAVFHETFLNVNGDKAIQERGRKAGGDIARWINLEAERRGGVPSGRGDLIDALLAQVVKGTLPADQVAWITAGLLVGAIDTTATAVANIARELLSDAALRDNVMRDIDDPRRLTGWCWEALRRRPHNPLLLREAAADALIAGKPINAKTRVWALTLAAMQDARAFPDPAGMRPDRPLDLYLHFGAGLHRCSGRQFNARHIPLLVRTLLRHGASRPHDLRFHGPFPDRLIVELERRS